jgi:DNA-binding SARP family transcriptional activator
MGILQVGLFGGVRATLNDWITEIQLTRENQGLLAYFLLQRHKLHSREILADLFWGHHSQEKARGSLNTALWKLKKALEPESIRAGTYLKNSHSGEVGFNKDSPYWLDAEVFERGINEIVVRPFQTVEEVHLVALNKVLELYKGDLLEGVYSDWALRERERLRTLYLKSLIYLLQFHGFRGAYEKAIAYGQQVLALDPLREEIHRELIRLYWKNGQRALAVRQYETCRSILAKELRIAPLEDTQRLYTQIVKRTGDPDSTIVSGSEIGIEGALRQLRVANEAIEVAKSQIQQALQLLVKLDDPQDRTLM